MKWVTEVRAEQPAAVVAVAVPAAVIREQSPLRRATRTRHGPDSRACSSGVRSASGGSPARRAGRVRADERRRRGGCPRRAHPSGRADRRPAPPGTARPRPRSAPSRVISSSRRAATGVGMTRSSMPSAVVDVESSSVAGMRQQARLGRRGVRAVDDDRRGRPGSSASSSRRPVGRPLNAEWTSLFERSHDAVITWASAIRT